MSESIRDRMDERHQNAVEEIAMRLERQGYQVAADAPGFDRPRRILGFAPDIIVRRGPKEIIIEVKRAGSASFHDMQREGVFRRVARRNPRMEFRVVLYR